MEEEPETRVQSGRRSGDFEFWNPSCPQLNLLSADELFAGGFVLPLHLLNLSNEKPPPFLHRDIDESGSEEVPRPEMSVALATDLSADSFLTSSKRWMDIFRKSDKKMSMASDKSGNATAAGDKEISLKEKKREKKNVRVGTAELNINIWPFSRSRSAGNGATRPRSAAAHRKVSSAPCSRSNSAGESKSRKSPSSPSRSGIHIGRTSPVWQIPRGGSGRNKENQCRRRSPGGVHSKSKVLTLNIPMCIGYRQQLNCRNPINHAAGGDTGDIPVTEVSGSPLFIIRSFFSKKVY